MTITIRAAEPGDYEAIRDTMAQTRAHTQTLQVPYPSLEMWKKRLADKAPTDHVLVAEIDGKVIGNAGLHAVGPSPRRRHAAHLGMSVHDDWQRRGAGAALMAALIDLADNWLQYTRLELTVYTDNDGAIALYKKFGFEIEGTLKQYAMRNGVLTDVYTMARMKK
ncbi:MAG: GNAT family N-acetyltransferase [Betaproteobacteria bacterium]|nr:GNAT family N-acetyltransferase [Betaproteobacteria bacterium]